MNPFYLWLACLVIPPAVVIVVSRSKLEAEKLRRMTVICALLMFAVGSAILFVPQLHSFELSLTEMFGRFWGAKILRINEFSSALIPLPAALWLLTVTVTPRLLLERAGLPRTATVTLITTFAYMSENPGLLLVMWIISIMLYLVALSTDDMRHARRVAGCYLWTSAVFFTFGILFIALSESESILWQLGIWLIIAAALIRKGIFPLHAWLPEVFERGQLGPIILFSAPQMGSYIMAVMIVPRVSPEILRIIAIMALFTAVYGAALALFQRDARRSCGYLFMSQSALVMVGLDCASTEALTGSLILWLSSAVAFAGIARCVLVIEARRGRLDLSRHYGGYDQMPLLATSFLILGLACTGFPGTLGFVGEELIVEGAVKVFPVLGFFVVVTGALTGLAVLRMYFSLFCGHRGGEFHLNIRRREVVAFTTAMAFLIITGLLPGPIVASRLRASNNILEQQLNKVTAEKVEVKG